VADHCSGDYTGATLRLFLAKDNVHKLINTGHQQSVTRT
jgi:hypothetical protein